MTASEKVIEQSLEWPGHPVEVQLVDEDAGVLGFMAGVSAHEPAKLLLGRPSALGGLLLQRSKRPEIAVRFEDLLHPNWADGAN